MLVRMYRNWSPHTLPVGMSNGGGILENSLLILNWLNIVLTCDPAITLLGIYGRELKMYVQTKTGTQIFIAALVTTAKGRSNASAHQRMNG